MATFGTFVAGQVLTAAELNGVGVWQDYTPSWTQGATITKTVNFARYTQLNKLVIVNLKMTASSAGTASSPILVGLPVSASSNNSSMGLAFMFDVSAGDSGKEGLFSVYESATTVHFLQTRSGESDKFGINLTIASGDIISATFTYEAS
jgi:hypothetical protein